jgi:signal transduction histidine kinase
MGDAVVSGMAGFAATLALVICLAVFGGLSVIGIGLVLLVAWVYVASAVVAVQRWKARELYDIDTARGWRAPPPHTRRRGFGAFVGRTWDRFTDREFWRGLGRVAAGGVLGILFLGLAGWAIQGAFSLLAGIVRGYTGIAFLGTTLGPWWAALVAILLLAASLGLFLLFAVMSRAMDAEMLGAVTREEYSRRLDSLEGERTGAVSAAEEQRVRIERDLHDGVQPQLVNVAMTIDMARRAMTNDPDAQVALALLDEAHSSSKEAITSLRQTVRGIHPAVLTDRGLDAALSALAARATVPVDLNVDLPRRPAADAEAAVYFVVAEALHNVGTHAYASSARVVVRPAAHDETRLQVIVSDDGAGGATLDAGPRHTGLRGMRDRLIAVGGTLEITSPAGGPTTIVGELPCGS